MKWKVGQGPLLRSLSLSESLSLSMFAYPNRSFDSETDSDDDSELHVEKTTNLRGIEKHLTVVDDDRQRSEVRTLAWPADAEAVFGLVPGAMGVAHQILLRLIPEVARLSLVETHGKVAALVFVGADLTIGHSQEDSLLVKGAVLVCEAKPFTGYFVEGGDTFHGRR